MICSLASPEFPFNIIAIIVIIISLLMLHVDIRALRLETHRVRTH